MGPNLSNTKLKSSTSSAVQCLGGVGCDVGSAGNSLLGEVADALVTFPETGLLLVTEARLLLLGACDGLGRAKWCGFVVGRCLLGRLLLIPGEQG
jgi:hypothetical protein